MFVVSKFFVRDSVGAVAPAAGLLSPAPAGALGVFSELLDLLKGFNDHSYKVNGVVLHVL